MTIDYGTVFAALPTSISSAVTDALPVVVPVFGALVGLSILIARRLGDTRIRRNSKTWDIIIVFMLWLQLALGLGTVVLSARHMDGLMFEQLTDYVKGVVTFRPNIAALLDGVPLVYQTHIALGFTIFLVSPFTRMVHIWSGIASLGYLIRPYQLVRKR